MKRRGQAFETMMLVISVIVAVAILGVLLGFLSNINLFGQDAKSVIQSLIKDVSNKGYGAAAKENVQFDVAKIYSNEITKGLSITKIEFFCAKGSKDFCDASVTPTPPLSIKLYDKNTEGSFKIDVNKKVAGNIVVCTGNGDDYYVFISKRNNEAFMGAEADAEEKCGLT